MTLNYNHLNPYQKDDYQIIDETVVFWDWPNLRIKILTSKFLNHNTLARIKETAVAEGMGKVIACAPPSCEALFKAQGFEVEGKIKGYFAGQDALFYSYFADSARKLSVSSYNGLFPVGSSWDRCEDAGNTPRLAYDIRTAVEADIPEMIRLFKLVFTSYPSPVFDVKYLYNNMVSKRVLYKAAVFQNKIIGIASAEKDQLNRNAEITDCATNPQFRGQGILSSLIIELEENLNSEGYICLYTLCRSTQAAVNKAFFRQGYSFSGRLIKNCHICGSFEDMNILVKNL